jgi:hypothetical protein
VGFPDWGAAVKADDIAALVEAALRSQQLEDVDPASKNLPIDELIDHPSGEVFDAASRLVASQDIGEKKLGVRVLRELGRPEMPYAVETIPLLMRLLDQQPDTELLVWIVSAIGNQHRAEVLPALWRLAVHPEPAVRDAVCGAISGAAGGSVLDDRSVDVLQQLSRDPDDDVRFSATFELAAWQADGMRDSRIDEAMERARRDSDPRIARIAVDDPFGSPST